jgi:hypothetical protein
MYGLVLPPGPTATRSLTILRAQPQSDKLRYAKTRQMMGRANPESTCIKLFEEDNNRTRKT